MDEPRNILALAAKAVVLGLPMLFLPAPAAVSAAPAKWSYDTVVEPTPRPAWMEKVVMICESPWADANRKELKPNMRVLKDAGFTLMNMYPDGFCRLYSATAGETWPQECHAEVKAMHAIGMKALAGCYPTVGSRGPRDLLTAHPEWQIRKGDALEKSDFGCLLSPFGDALVDLLVERIKEYDIDGYQFDGWYQATYCRCPGCKERYKKETGLEIPKFDQADPAYLKYLMWRDEKLLQRMEQLRKAARAAKPDAVLVQWNNNDCGGSYPSWMPEALNCVSDWTNKEWWDAHDCTNMWLIKRLRGSSGDRPAGVQPYMFMRHGIDIQSGVYHGSSCPIEEVLYRMHKVMVLGSIPIIWPGARSGWTDEDSMRVSRDLADFLPYIHETGTVKYALCIDSYTTLQMQRTNKREDVEEHVTAHRGGTIRALVEEHIPFDVASEHNITAAKLAQYKVVILPNYMSMPPRIADLLRDYVKKGGGLVATYETSLYDEWGKRLPEFALSDLFGATYISSAPVRACRVDYTRNTHPVCDDQAIRKLTGTRGNTTYYGSFARVKPAPGAVAPMVGLDVANEKDDALKNWTPLLLSDLRKGRVAYFPAAIDAAYYNAGYPYERMLFANAIRWAAGTPPQVKVTAPMCVIAGFLTKGNATVVHLLSDSNSTGGHGSKEDKQFAIREESIPISGVKVAFPGEKPKDVLLIPGKTRLEPRKTDHRWEVTVPRLDLHAVVVAEYGR
jgi:hypothetical protein